MKATIYCLLDSRNIPFYVGCTAQKLNTRLSMHKCDARQYLKGRNSAWFSGIEKSRGIVENNFNVSITALEKFSGDKESLLKKEYQWYLKLKSFGFYLSNSRFQNKIKKAAAVAATNI